MRALLALAPAVKLMATSSQAPVATRLTAANPGTDHGALFLRRYRK